MAIVEVLVAGFLRTANMRKRSSILKGFARRSLRYLSTKKGGPGGCYARALHRRPFYLCSPRRQGRSGPEGARRRPLEAEGAVHEQGRVRALPGGGSGGTARLAVPPFVRGEAWAYLHVSRLNGVPLLDFCCPIGLLLQAVELEDGKNKSKPTMRARGRGGRGRRSEMAAATARPPGC